MLKITSQHRARLLDLHEVAEALHRGEEVTIARFGADVCPEDRDPGIRLRRALKLATDMGVPSALARRDEARARDAVDPREFVVACADVRGLRRAVEIGLRTLARAGRGRNRRKGDRDYDARRRAKASREGKCSQCLKRAVEPGRVTCRTCRATKASHDENERMVLTELGVCSRCKIAPAPVYCDPCREIVRGLQNAYNARCRSEGVCYLCPRKAPSKVEEGRTTCRDCRLKTSQGARVTRRLLIEKKLAKGLCDRNGCRESRATSARTGKLTRKCAKHGAREAARRRKAA